MYNDISVERRGDAAHTRVVCKVRTSKPDPNQTRITIGGITITYLGNCGTKTGSLETVKLMLNSTLSTPDARFMTTDLEIFYLMTPLDRPEYAHIQLSVMPQEIINEYDLDRGFDWVSTHRMHPFYCLFCGWEVVDTVCLAECMACFLQRVSWLPLSSTLH